MERLYDRMIAFDSATTGAAQLVHKSYLRTFKVQKLRKIATTTGYAYKVAYSVYPGRNGSVSSGITWWRWATPELLIPSGWRLVSLNDSPHRARGEA